MNKEFHYWMTGIIAHSAGFNNKETQIIAYSSQFVDDNDNAISVFDDEMSPLPSYKSVISQTMDFLLPRKDLMGIYPLFHFIPGDMENAAPRRDKKTRPLNTTQNSSNAQQIMQNAVEAFVSRNPLGLYRLGIATHAFADTWAHQNFTGSWDDFNDMGNVATPNVGHADALHHPDWVSHRWNDDRLDDANINNNTRYMDAARCVYGIYEGFLASSGRTANNSWAELEKVLLDIFGTTYSGGTESGVDGRVTQYKALVPFLPDYDDRDWQFAAFNVKMVHTPAETYEERYFWASGISKESTDWYKFQEAIKEHVFAATNVLGPVLAQAGITV